MEKETKECPFCWEEILATAVKCKHCWEFLDWTKREETTTSNQFAWIINYKSWLQVRCPSCWYEWKPKNKVGWSTLVELILLICGILPWILYSIYRRTSWTAKCPKCWNTMLIIKQMK